MIEYTDFIHPSDKKALEALKAVPGFDLVMKKFMSIVGEKMFQIEATSSFLKLGPEQLPEIYNILVKVCKKLEIEVPELYLKLDREPNAYTNGDTDIFIVLHSGLLETMSLAQIETVIAHECGHIVCHHVLYHTMGNLLLSCAELFVNGMISRAIITPIQYAFYYWMRCSEFSADRVSAYYHNSPEPVIDVMMALSGGTHNLNLKLNKEAFFKQAENYKGLIENSTYNKALEFIQFGLNSHPLNAYRAYEINEFYKKYKKKLLTADNSSSDNENNIEEVTQEYNLRIQYVYIKPKGFLKLGGTFDNNNLKVKVHEKEYTISKNDIQDIRLQNGMYTLTFSNNETEINYDINLQYDMKLLVKWNSQEKLLSVKEEL